MDLVIIVLMMALGSSIGLLAGWSTSGISAEGVFAMLVVGYGVGAFSGLAIVSVLHTKRRNIRRKARLAAKQARAQTPIHPPRPFQTRLAEFAGKSEQEIASEPDTFQSKMPFWTVVHVFLRVPPKSAAFIRRILLSIRRVSGH